MGDQPYLVTKKRIKKAWDLIRKFEKDESDLGIYEFLLDVTSEEKPEAAGNKKLINTLVLDGIIENRGERASDEFDDDDTIYTRFELTRNGIRLCKNDTSKSFASFSSFMKKIEWRRMRKNAWDYCKNPTIVATITASMIAVGYNYFFKRDDCEPSVPPVIEIHNHKHYDNYEIIQYPDVDCSFPCHWPLINLNEIQKDVPFPNITSRH